MALIHHTEESKGFLMILSVSSLEILVASDFDKVAGAAIYYLHYYHM